LCVRAARASRQAKHSSCRKNKGCFKHGSSSLNCKSQGTVSASVNVKATNFIQPRKSSAVFRQKKTGTRQTGMYRSGEGELFRQSANTRSRTLLSVH
jgi:hypothetical protein